MTNKEKAALLAAGETELGSLEKGMEDSLRKENFDLAWSYQCQYSGAAYMLRALGLINCEDYLVRSRAVFDRFLAAKFPDVSKEETS